MSYRYYPILSIIAASNFGFGCVSDSSDLSIEPDQEQPQEDEFARAERAFNEGKIDEVEAELIAEFHLSNGNKIEFFNIAEDNELFAEESAAPNTPMAFAVMDGWTVPEMFLSLAPETLPVPKPIATHAIAQGLAVAERQLVERLAEPMNVDVATLAMLGYVPYAGVGYCTPSNAGVFYFDNHSCKVENLRDSWCDAGNYISGGGWLTLIRSGHNKKRDSHSRTAACGANGQARHYYWNGFRWKTANTWEIPANDQRWRTHNGAIKRYRKVEHKTFHPTSGGFIRAWTEFHN